MGSDPAVQAWFDALEHPLKEAMLQVRATILGVDDRIDEAIKWKSPTFVFRGNIASIDPRAKKHVNLMFHQGAALPGKHPLLQGGGGTVRYARFETTDEVVLKRPELEASVRAWIELKSS